MQELSSFWSDDDSLEAVVIKCNSRFTISESGDNLRVKKVRYLVEVYKDGELSDAAVFDELEQACIHAEDYVLNHAQKA
jgi:hypothetical protein